MVKNRGHRYPLACREDVERLGVRLLAGPLAGAMCPIFQTSANLSGKPAPGRFADIPDAILGEVDLAIDGGELTGLPSTVVDIAAIDDGGDWEILREGAISEGDLASALASRRPRLAPVAQHPAPVKGSRTRRCELLSPSFDSNSRCFGSTVIPKTKQPRRPLTSMYCSS